MSYFPRHTSKYHAVKTKGIFHGEEVEYDSKKEAIRGFELLVQESEGTISNLKRQVSYILIDKSQWGRAIRYVADFTYYKDGELVVEDVKGFKTDVYQLKKRLMKERYQIKIHEI